MFEFIGKTIKLPSYFLVKIYKSNHNLSAHKNSLTANTFAVKKKNGGNTFHHTNLPVL